MKPQPLIHGDFRFEERRVAKGAGFTNNFIIEPIPNTAMSFAKSRERLIDALYCLKQGFDQSESVLFQDWVNLQKDLASNLKNEKVLAGLMDHIRGFTEIQYGVQGDSYYYSNGRRIGSLKHIAQGLWFLIAQL